jgi:hypothetical protein
VSFSQLGQGVRQTVGPIGSTHSRPESRALRPGDPALGDQRFQHRRGHAFLDRHDARDRAAAFRDVDDFAAPNSCEDFAGAVPQFAQAHGVLTG